MRRFYRAVTPRVPDYERLPDGRLDLGTPCFSGPRLKKRFASEEQAREWIASNPRSNQKTYECIICKGWHLTTKNTKPKKRKKRK